MGPDFSSKNEPKNEGSNRAKDRELEKKKTEIEEKIIFK